MSGMDNSDSFAPILERNKGIIHKIARAYCQNEEVRKDLIQEMTIQIWRSTPHYNHQFKLSTWIYRICLNVAISWHRKQTTGQMNMISLDERGNGIHEPEGSGDLDQNIETLYRFISELKELERAIMILYLEEKSYREIGEILGITETNVATKINRIKSKLKEKFQTKRAS